MLRSNVDIPRAASTSFRQRIKSMLATPDSRILVLTDEPGTGKTAFLRRIAFDFSQTHKNVFWFSGRELIDEESTASILEDIADDCMIFVDNWADHLAYFLRVLRQLDKRNIVVVAAERSYRRPYIESALSSEEIEIQNNILSTSHDEAENLILACENAGLSTLGIMTQGTRAKHASLLQGQPLQIILCRIQENFKPFDVIIKSLISDSKKEEADAYITVGIARFCYSGGLRRSILGAMFTPALIEELISLGSKLPVKYNSKGGGFLTPRRSVVADRFLSYFSKTNKVRLQSLFVGLANELAARVNREQIRLRTPEARLAGRLLDFDQIVKTYINDQAESFYDAIKDKWSWNSRYWEQMALLKLDRYLLDKTDSSLLTESIQHARHAYAIERHPLSLTTLAKLLFTAMPSDYKQRDELFNEAWYLITESIEMETRWDNLRATAFIVCFNGVISYTECGGILSGEQADKLRDVIAITYSRKLRDRRLNDLREEIKEIVSPS